MGCLEYAQPVVWFVGEADLPWGAGGENFRQLSAALAQPFQAPAPAGPYGGRVLAVGHLDDIILVGRVFCVSGR